MLSRSGPQMELEQLSPQRAAGAGAGLAPPSWISLTSLTSVISVISVRSVISLAVFSRETTTALFNQATVNSKLGNSRKAEKQKQEKE